MYWGDIVSGPLLVYGIESKNKDLMKLGNNLPVASSEMVTEWNHSLDYSAITILTIRLF